MAHKREIPETLKALLKFDAVLSSKICAVASKVVRTDQIKGYLSALEISCHGLLWLGAWLVYIWFWWHPDRFQMQVNFYLALVIDIVAVALSKAFFRRRRPPGNKLSKFQSMGPDAFSFPSGHVSRSFLVYFFFTYLFPVGMFWSTIILIWAISVSVSRLLLHMHYLLDILGGIALSIINFSFISMILISKSTSDWFIMYVTEERLDGGEYHV